LKKIKNVKLILTDVDGVLTDGGRYFSKNGEELKKFHTRDGMGVNLLLRNGIKTAIVTKEKSPITKKWAIEMNVAKTYSGVIFKEKILSKICTDFKVNPNEIGYIGDDVNDIELLKKVGFSACPHDGSSFTKKSVDYVCKIDGGQGSFREIADLILSTKFPSKNKWY